MAVTTPNIIKDKDYVILKRENSMKIFKIKTKRQVFIDRLKITLDGIIGHPYGTTFEWKEGKMVKVDRTPHLDMQHTSAAAEMGTDRDNRNLQDSDSNQRLSRDEIEQMKKEGVSGEQLIEQLIENSATFQEKTEYSQEKWVKKKKKKHLMVFTVLKPNSRLMCEMYWSQDKRKICNLRIDSLAQILTHGNIRAGMTVAVVDRVMGIVAGAVLERLGGFGKVISFCPGDKIPSQRTLLEQYDFSKDVMDSIHYFPLELVNSLKHSTLDKPFPVECQDTSSAKELSEENSKQKETETSASKQTEAETSKQLQTETGTSKQTDSNKNETGSSASASKFGDKSGESGPKSKQSGKGNKRQKGRKEKGPVDEAAREAADAARKAAEEKKMEDIEVARKLLLSKKIDCLIIASPYNPTPIVLALLDYVAPSRQVIVFSQFLEAIKDCYVYLRENGGMISFRATETWLREYQVLPNRTHPMVTMSGSGGFLLTATKVLKPEQ